MQGHAGTDKKEPAPVGCDEKRCPNMEMFPDPQAIIPLLLRVKNHKTKREISNLTL